MKLSCLTGLFVIGVWFLPATAQTVAQSDPPEPTSVANGGAQQSSTSLNEVIVTAQKFTQRAFDVPISLAVIGGPELKTDLVRSLDDLASVVPGLAVEDEGGTFRIEIRGASDLVGQGTLVGSYLDEADV